MTATELRNPLYGEKVWLIRKVRAENPEADNIALAALVNEEAARAGLRLQVTNQQVGYVIYRDRQTLLRKSQRGQGKRKSAAPTTAQLRLVKVAIDDAGGPARFRERLEAALQILQLAEEAGGADSLRECLRFWEEVLA